MWIDWIENEQSMAPEKRGLEARCQGHSNFLQALSHLTRCQTIVVFCLFTVAICMKLSLSNMLR